MTAAPPKRATSIVVRPIGRTTIGCSSPDSASPRTTPRVRKTASTAPRKRVANIARPKITAPVKAWASRIAGSPAAKLSTSRNAKWEPRPKEREEAGGSAAAPRGIRAGGSPPESRGRPPPRPSAAGRSSRLPADRVEVAVFERAVAHLDPVDALAGGDEAQQLLGRTPAREA